MKIENIPTPRVDSDSRSYPSPEQASRILFEGRQCVVMAPEEYEDLYRLARLMEKELMDSRETADDWMGRHYALHSKNVALVEALESSVATLETAADYISPVRSAGGIELASKIMRQRDRARAALAKATGGKAHE